MALTQMQLIQSLGEAMAWFEREIGWGVPATELRHLCGRIGELYVAMITNGQMATEVNQRGYNVVSSSGERISVKTTATTGNAGHISFNSSSLELVDRVIVLRVNTEEMQVETLLDVPVAQARALMRANKGERWSIPIRRLVPRVRIRNNVKSVAEVSFEGYVVRELENGSIEVLTDGVPVVPVKPELKTLAVRLNIGLLNSRDNPLNTRQLGSRVITTIQERNTRDNA